MSQSTSASTLVSDLHSIDIRRDTEEKKPSFAELLNFIAKLPLGDEEKAAAIRQLLASKVHEKETSHHDERR